MRIPFRPILLAARSSESGPAHRFNNSGRRLPVFFLGFNPTELPVPGTMSGGSWRAPSSGERYERATVLDACLQLPRVLLETRDPAVQVSIPPQLMLRNIFP
ncbi:Os09g0550925 [Oryza sativa Japonica Group]|uniref:Os09g0550925 protein n=1 Tax=Oryza sativa subsp. japonica TaxID=39947 RepID=A0A0P0XQ48_ORYSJ|nr:Os09g0550925 [Oryza sativa Japonica Group]